MDEKISWSRKGNICYPKKRTSNIAIWVNNRNVAQTLTNEGGGPGVVVSTAAFHARVRGSVPSLGGSKETKNFLPHPRVKVSIVGSLRDREVACSASDRQGSNFESCVWRTVSSQSSHHPQEVLLAQFSLYVHKGGLKPDSFHFLTNDFASNTADRTSNGIVLQALIFDTRSLTWDELSHSHILCERPQCFSMK